MRLPKLSALVSILLAVANHSAMCPDTVVSELTSEPASLFDIALLRMERILEALPERSQYDEVPDVRYDADGGRIEIVFFKTLPVFDENWKKSCTLILSSLIPGLDIRLFSPISHVFSHRDMKPKDETKEEKVNAAMRNVTDVHLRLRGASKIEYSQGCSITVGQYSNQDYSAVKFRSSIRGPAQ